MISTNITVFGSGSKGNCYLLDDGKTKLMLECGLPIKKIKENLKYSLVDGCLVTHEHLDHAKSIKDIALLGIDCYLSQGTADAMGIKGHRIKIVKSRKQFKINTWEILPFDAVHDSKEPLNFLLFSKVTKEKILYITDTAYCKYKFDNVDVMLVEANYSIEIIDKNVAEGIISLDLRNRILQSHMSIETFKKMLSDYDLSKLKQIWLIHLSDHNSDTKQFKKEIAELTGVEVYVV